MKPAAAPPAQESKPSRGKRGCLITGIVLVLMVPAYYWLENYTGRRALAKEVQEYADSGFPLEANAVLPAAVPDTDKARTMPLLDAAKWETLASVLPYRTDSNAPVIRTVPGAVTSTTSPAPVLAATAELHSIHDAEPVWKNIRFFLLTRTTCTPQADEPSDVRAVYESLETHRAIFAELIAAALRPRALVPLGLLESWQVSGSDQKERLSRLLLLRARAAASLGNQEEAAALADVLWRLRSACLAESSWSGHAQSNDIERFWFRSVRTILHGTTQRDNLLKQLLSSCGSDWSPEKELQRSFHGEASLFYIGFKDRHEQAFDTMGWGFSDLQEKLLRFGPSGWVERNVITSLRRIRSYVLRPLNNGTFRDLPASMAALDAEVHSQWKGISPSTFLGHQIIHSRNFRDYLFVPVSIRLTLLAIAMERYRLKHGRYPTDSTTLVPDCIAAIPLDIDGAPLRIVTSPDGAKSVLYSIGWNLTDDWHGVLPATYKEEDDWQNADWPLSLPFPPLPPP